MPSLLYPVFPLPEMCDKKSPPRKERPIFVNRTPQPDDRGMKRKLLSPSYSPSNDDDSKVTPNKRKRGILSVEGSPQPLTTPKTPVGAPRPPPLSERQQLAMIMRMNDGPSQGAPITEQADGHVMSPLSPSPLLPAMRKTPVDKKATKRNERGELPIHIAAIRGDVKLVKKLIRAQVDVNVSDWAGWTPLHEACNHGWLSVSKQLLKAGANVNVQGLDNDTPLHDASVNGHKKLVELLLKHGANPVQPNSNGKTPVDIAASPDIVKLLKREMIMSSSDSSSVDEGRSPLSPDSIISKDDEHSLDSEDLPRSRTGSSSSSSNQRPLTIPQSPDNKLASPRLCLKFQRELHGQTGYAAKDSKIPQYKSSYSVTSLSLDSDDSSSSPFEHFGSGADSELCKPGTQGYLPESRLKLTGGEGLNCTQPGSTVIQPNRTSPSALEFCTGDGNVHNNKVNDSVKQLDFSGVDSTTNSGAKPPLKFMESEPFTPHMGWSALRDQKLDYDLPDLEPDLSVSNIPVSEPHSRLAEPADCDTHPRGSMNNSGEGRLSNNSLHSAAVSSSTGAGSRTFVESTVNGSEVTGSDHDIHTVTNKRFKPSVTENVNNVSSSSVVESRNVTNLKWELRSSASPKSENGSVHLDQWDFAPDTVSPSELVTQPDNEPDTLDIHIDSRSSSPKVPPLKIVMLTKSTATSSTTESVCVKSVASKSPGVPYVINPSTQDNAVSGMVEPDQGLGGVESTCVSSAASQISSSVFQPLVNVCTPGLSSTYRSDQGGIHVTCDTSLDSKTTELLNKDDTTAEADDKKDEPIQRITRSSARVMSTKPDSRMWQKHDKDSNAESPADTDGGNSVAIVTTNTGNREEEEDQDIQAKKRKIRPKPESTPVQPVEASVPSPLSNVLDKVPNPYELFLSLRKQVAIRRRNIGSICPKIPQGYKDYLMKTCNYVLEGNTTSTLSVPTLSPPNSVKIPMSDMFMEQEKIRYKLRLQHLIEREKLILSIEQEILREHCRAARAMVNQGIPLSVCTILRDEEIYNSQDLDQQEKEDKRHRSRFNGRQFISWLQDVGDKYQKIKESLILRQKQEADSLYAIQKLEWGWKLQETGECERNVTPDIDDLHVPLVHVQDNFELLPT